MANRLVGLEPTKHGASVLPRDARFRLALSAESLLVGAWLPASGLALSLLFDIHALSQHAAWWSALGQLGYWLPLGFVVCVALAFALAEPLVAELRNVARPHRARFWLVSLSGYGVALATSPTVLAEGSATLSTVSAWATGLLVWLVAGMHALMPLPSLLRILLSQRARTLAAFAIGVGAFLLGHAWESQWDLLAPLTLGGAASVLDLLGQDPWRAEDHILGVGEFAVRVAPECSGIEGVGVMAAFLAGFIAVFRAELHVRRALAIVPFALFASLALNVLRISLLMLVGAHYSAAVAVSGFHSKSGWLFFSLTALASIAILRHAPFFARDELPVFTERPRGALEPYLLPLVVLTLTGLITGLFSSGLDRGYGLRVVAAGACLLLLRGRANLGPALTPQGVLGCVLAGVLALPIWLALSPRDSAKAAELADAWASLGLGERITGMALRVAGATLVVPWAEELAFRGFLLRRFVSSRFEAVTASDIGWVAVLLSSLAFGLAHGGYWLPGTATGVLYACIAIRIGVRGAIVAHGVTNLALAAFVLWQGAFDLW